MSRSFRQIALIGLLACMVSFTMPAAVAPRAHADESADRLTRTIRQLAERAAETERDPQPSPPTRPESQPEQPSSASGEPLEAGQTQPREPHTDPSTGDETNNLESPALDPNELRHLGPSGDDRAELGEDSRPLSSDGGWVLETLAALGIVIGLILLLRWAWIRFGGGGAAAATTPVVEVLSRTPIAPRNHVLLLRIGPRILIVGDSNAGMRTLASVEDEQEVADLLAAINASKPDSISRNFQQLLGRFGAAHDQQLEQPGDADQLGWADFDDGRDGAEHVFDRARNNVSGLASRIRTLTRKGGGR